MDIRTSSGKKLRPRIEFWNSEESRTSFQGAIIENCEGRVSASGIVPDGYTSIRLLIDANLSKGQLDSSTDEEYKCMVFRKGTETYWTPTESELISSYTPNLFDYKNDIIKLDNVIKDNNYGFKQEVGDSEQRYNWQIILVKDSNTYKLVVDTSTKIARRLVMHFTISNDYANCRIRFKQNGRSIDTGIWLDNTELYTPGDYTFSVEITNTLNNEISFKNIKLERGTVLTPVWTPAKSEWVEPEGPFNLLKNSKPGYIITEADSPADTTYYTYINWKGYLEYTLKSLVTGSTKEYRWYYMHAFQIENFIEGVTYTFSCDIKSNCTGHIYILSRLNNSNKHSIAIVYPNTLETWIRFSRTLTLTELKNNTLILLLLEIYPENPIGSEVSIRKVCLTKGTSPEYAPTYEEFKNSTKITKIYKDNKLVYNE